MAYAFFPGSAVCAGLARGAGPGLVGATGGAGGSYGCAKMSCSASKALVQMTKQQVDPGVPVLDLRALEFP
jgi:hypothetical protein